MIERIKPVEILLVEDNPADVDLIRETLSESKIANNWNAVENGEQALSYLRAEKSYAARTLPDLILLDINLPRKTGLDVLKEIRSDPQLTDLAIVMLTSSNSPDDIQASYRMHVNAYVRKPLDLEEFVAAVRSIDGFWLSIVRLPRNSMEQDKR